jgi:hypothetical protein
LNQAIEQLMKANTYNSTLVLRTAGSLFIREAQVKAKNSLANLASPVKV